MATAFLTGAPLGAVRLTCARTFGWAWVEVVLAAWVAVLEGLLSSPPPLRTRTSTPAMGRGAGGGGGAGGRGPPARRTGPRRRETRGPAVAAGAKGVGASSASSSVSC